MTTNMIPGICSHRTAHWQLTTPAPKRASRPLKNGDWLRVPARRDNKSREKSFPGDDRAIHPVLIERRCHPFAGAVPGQREQYGNWTFVQVAQAGVVLRPSPAGAHRNHLERSEALVRQVIGRLPQ